MMKRCFGLVFLVAGGALAADEGAARLTHVAPVAGDVIELTYDCGAIEYGRRLPYAKQDGDTVADPQHNRWVYRGGKCIGALVSGGRELHTLDRLVGDKIDPRPLEKPAAYRVSSENDANFAKPLQPSAVWRKSKPTDFGRVAPWEFQAPMRHTLYLKLPRALRPGATYTIHIDAGPAKSHTFRFAPAELRSEAVHVSHLGFRPDDPAKVAFLSCWLGTGGGMKYSPGLRFDVIDANTGRSVLTGRTELSKAATDRTEDSYNANHNGTDVWLLDFSSLKRPGVYRVCVAGVGCSYTFEIGDDAWRRAFRASVRGFYHQRSGIALGPPYTDFVRPRPMHPDDGVKVYASAAALMDTGNGLNRKDTNFGNLVAGGTDAIVPNAWGGYMDAGDWDRRIQHLCVSRLLLELAGLFPEYFAKLDLNIPESKDDLPDVVNEALWNLDCYRRMQTPEGGIRGGIESAEHPRQGEGSWEETLRIYAYAPGVWSSYVYAGVAARAANWLSSRKPERSAVYRDSALRAMLWAEKRLAADPNRKWPIEVNDDRNLAAAELFRLTGEDRWGKLFLDTTAFKDPKADLFVWQHHEQREAAWVCARTERPGAGAKVRANCIAAIVREADDRRAWCLKRGFRWAQYSWRPTVTGTFSAPADCLSLIRAHVLTGREKYLATAVLACQSGAGANPVNLCYTTGLGHDWPRHALHVDARILRREAPPGLTVFGPCDTKAQKDQWGQKLVARFAFPAPEAWPDAEAYWDVFWHPLVCEYTVQDPMAANAYVWGYLAARPAADDSASPRR